MLCILLFAGSLTPAHAQALPVATAGSATTLATVNGNAGKIAANNLGDVFYVSQGSNIAYWLPRGATTPTTLVTALSGARNVYVDTKNNVYIASTYGGFILEVPYVNGTYATAVVATSASPCTSFSPTVPCQQGSASANLAYYYQPSDVSMDASGNLYAIDAYPNGTCTAGDCIVKFTRGTSTYNAPTVVVNNITAVDYNAQLSAAPNGDLYFANTKLLYYIAAGTTTAVASGTYTSPAGVATDSLGNVYVTNSSTPYTIYEIPALNGAAQFTKVFPLVSTYSANTIALDSLGDLFYTGYSSSTNVNVTTLNAINTGSANVGTAAASTNIGFTFASATTVGGIVATGTGFVYAPGSCAVGSSYAAGTSCTVNVVYTPTAVGVQRGAISLTNASGVALSTALLAGTGLGAAQTNDPGTLTSIGTAFTTPAGIAVDGAGNVFVADSGQNAVLRYAGGTGTGVSIGTGLLKPSSVALDGAGNVYIADGGNNRVVEVPNIGGTLTNSAQSVIASGLGSTLSIATDRYGNLYIADAAQTTITRLASIGGTPSTSASTTIGSGFTMPYAIAVDRTGNVFVADYSTSLVSEINFFGRAQNTVGAGLSKPTGLTTDASGSLYIADSGNSRLLKIPLESGTFNTNDQYLVGSTVAVPYSVGIDNAGNLYVTDISKATVSEINRIAGTLSLGRAQIATTTAASNGYVGNSGNASLILGSPAYAAVSTTPTYFSVTAPSSNGCKSATTLASGFGCVLAATFSPTTTGTFTDLLTYSTNAVNGTPQTLTITGRGLNLAATTVTLAQTAPTGNAAFGSSVTIRATIGSAVAGTPTGTVTFSVDGNALTNPPTVANNVASVTLQNLTGGSHIVTATYAGDDNYAPNNGSLTITILQATSTTSVALKGVTLNPVSAVPGSAVTIVATVVPGASTAPTGGVTFSVGSLVLNATPVTLAVNSGAYIATLTTTALPLGTDVITATYAGDVNYSGSSNTASVLLSYPTFTVTPTTATVTLSSGQTGTVNLTATSLAGFANSTPYLGLVCTGLPSNAACAFNPNNFYFQQDAPQAITMQIVTGQTPIVPQPVVGAGITGKGRMSWLLLVVALAPLGLLGRRRAIGKLRTAGPVALLLLLALGSQMLTGCGSQLFGITPKGTYNVTVTATSSPTGYTGPSTLAAGCTTATDTVQYSSPTVVLTCVKTVNVTLVVQ